ATVWLRMRSKALNTSHGHRGDYRARRCGEQDFAVHHSLERRRAHAGFLNTSRYGHKPCARTLTCPQGCRLWAAALGYFFVHDLELPVELVTRDSAHQYKETAAIVRDQIDSAALRCPLLQEPL